MASIAAAAAVAVSAMLVLALTTQALPQTDDLCRAGTWPLKANAGAGTYFSFMYFYAGGRWAAAGVQTLALTSFPQPLSYPWLLLSVAAVQILLVFASVKLFLRRTRTALGVTAALASVYYAAIPNIEEAFYWFNGAIEDQLPLAPVVLTFALLLTAKTSGDAGSHAWRTSLGAGMALLVAGFHELWGGAFALALSGTAAVLLVKKRPGVRMWVVVAAAAWIGFLINYLAPGNQARMARTPGRADYATTLHFSLAFLSDRLFPWLLDVKHWLLALLMWVDPRIRLFGRKLHGAVSAVELGGFCCCWLSLLVAAAAAVAWNAGGQIPGRTLDILYGLFLAGWLASAFLAAGWTSRIPIPQARRRTFRSILLVLLSFQILGSEHVVWGATDFLSGRVEAWNTQWRRRFALLRTATPGSEVLVSPIRTYPRSYPPWDIAEDPRDWKNQCLAQSFGAASVRISRDRASDKD